jgi:acetolactate synthase-1/2/3 large subunit
VRRENLPVKIFVLNNRVLGKISETQHFNHGDRFANTAKSGGYTVPDFKKIAEAYGIKAAALADYSELDNYKEWFTDNDPCLFDISLPEDSLLTPKIKWETGKISPAIPEDVVVQVKSILQR